MFAFHILFCLVSIDFDRELTHEQPSIAPPPTNHSNQSNSSQSTQPSTSTSQRAPLLTQVENHTSTKVSDKESKEL